MLPVAGEGANVLGVELGAAVHVHGGGPGGGQRAPLPAHVTVRDPNPVS